MKVEVTVCDEDKLVGPQTTSYTITCADGRQVGVDLCEEHSRPLERLLARGASEAEPSPDAPFSAPQVVFQEPAAPVPTQATPARRAPAKKTAAKRAAPKKVASKKTPIRPPREILTVDEVTARRQE